MRNATNQELLNLYDQIELGVTGEEHELSDGSVLEVIEIGNLQGCVQRSRDGEIWQTLTIAEMEAWIKEDKEYRV